jgi:hypothetical protein
VKIKYILKKKTKIENVVTFIKSFGYKIFEKKNVDFDYFFLNNFRIFYITKPIMYLNKRLNKSAYILYL